MTMLGERPDNQWPQLGFSKQSVGDEVRIFVHEVPHCAGEALISRIVNDKGTWSPLAQAAKHVDAVHRAVMRLNVIVADPQQATLFYIPAFFKLLVDLLRSDDLDCIAETWTHIHKTHLMRNGGFDHFVIGGYFSMSGAIERDWTSYHPLARNVLNLVAGDPSYGHPDIIFNAGAMWYQLRDIFVPYSMAPFDCSARRMDRAPRDISVALVCTLNSRTRSTIHTAIRAPGWPFRGDPRVVVRVEETLEATFDELFDGNLWHLYRRSVWCIVVPGNLVDLTYRFYDVLRLGCLPVVLLHPPLVIAAPFAASVDYESFAHFAHVSGSEDVARIVERLVELAEDAEYMATRREAMIREAPRLFYEHLNCSADQATAGDAIVEELVVRQRVLAHTRFVGAPTL